MTKRWIGRIALWASLLLALCVVDASQSDPVAEARAPKAPPPPQFQLNLHAELADGTPFDAEKAWTFSVLRQRKQQSKLGGFERTYHLVKEGHAKGAQHSLPPLDQGTYWIIAYADGYARATAFVDLHESSSGKLVFQSAASLSVKLLAQEEEDLRPLQGATVLVGEPDDLPRGEQTDGQGEVTFERVPSGPQRVRIFAPGYEPYEGVAERELLVRLRPASTLRVTVTDRGVVQPDARVFIAGVGLWPARVVMTAKRGYVDITGLKPGRYALYAEKGNKISATQSDVEVKTRAGFVDVTLELEPGKYASAIVLSRENEKPIEGARVSWSSVGIGQFSRHTTTESDGIVRMGPLTRLRGVFTVRAAGFVPRVVPVEAPKERGGEELQIIRLERSATVEGRVVDAEGFPVPGATVEVAGTDIHGMPISVAHRSDEIADAHFDWAEDVANVLIPAGELGVMLGPVPPIPLADVAPSVGRRLTTDDKGYFLARDVPPGEVVVLARHPAHMDGKSKVLRLAPGGHQKTRVVLGTGQPLRGRVLDHDGFPVDSARIRISARGFDRRVTAESDGTFELGAAPEDVTLRISRIERPLRVVFSRKVEPGERQEEIEVRLPEPREEALIQVENAEGEAVELAQVTLISLDRSVPMKSTRFSGEQGEVRFEEAVGLRVRLEIAAPGYVTKRRDYTLKKKTTVTIRNALEAIGRVMGVRGRLPAEGAQIVVKSGGVTRAVVADEVGEYSLTGLPPGVVELNGSHPEYGSGKLKVRLKAREDKRPLELPDLQLSPMLKVSGTVVDQAGQALPGAIIGADRISPYLAAGGAAVILGRADESGRFTVKVGRDEPLYLYGAVVGRSFGFSDPIDTKERDRVEDVKIIIDRRDKIPPHELGTVLIALEDSDAGVLVYTVAPGSQAARTGMRPDDVIVEIDGSLPRDVEDARELLSGLPGSDLRLVIQRGGDELELVTSREAFLRK